MKSICVYELLWGSSFIQIFFAGLFKMVNRKFFTTDAYLSSLLWIVSHKSFQSSLFLDIVADLLPPQLEYEMFSMNM